MSESLLLPALIVAGLWILIMGVYLVVSRRQKSLGDDIAILESQLESDETR